MFLEFLLFGLASERVDGYIMQAEIRPAQENNKLSCLNTVEVTHTLTYNNNEKNNTERVSLTSDIEWGLLKKYVMPVNQWNLGDAVAVETLVHTVKKKTIGKERHAYSVKTDTVADREGFLINHNTTIKACSGNNNLEAIYTARSLYSTNTDFSKYDEGFIELDASKKYNAFRVKEGEYSFTSLMLRNVSNMIDDYKVSIEKIDVGDPSDEQWKEYPLMFKVLEQQNETESTNIRDS